MPAVDAGSLTICALSHECKKRKQGSGTPRDADQPSAPSGVRRAQSAARSPLGVPPRHLLQRANATAQPQLRASWDGTSEERVLPAPGRPAVQRSLRPQTGHRAGRAYPPGPPGNGGDEPPPAGTDSRSALRSDRMTSLYASEIERLFSNPERDVTELFPRATYAQLAGLSEVCKPRH